MTRQPPRHTLTDTLLPDTTLCRSAPLAELMAELDQAAGLAHDDSDAQRPWLVRHPLQPFDVRYFDGSDVRLFSYNPHYAAMHGRSEEHTSELQSLMRISYAVFCLKKKQTNKL